MTKDSQTYLLAHSKAKVDLYGTYLERYLPILANKGFNICLFDLLCGEGIYEDGGHGSPVIAINKLFAFLQGNPNTRSNFYLWFNDLESSKIEPSLAKVERVERYFAQSSLKAYPNVTPYFHQADYQENVQDALSFFESQDFAKGLFFIDPYGYKDIRPEHLRSILHNKHSEVLLFLPIQFMYRFLSNIRQEAVDSDLKPLKRFVESLFGTHQPLAFKTVDEFIRQLRQQFTHYLQHLNIYVDTFRIERDQGQVFCLFFFTSSRLGFEKMLEVKWKLDTKSGQGYKQENSSNQIMLFSATELETYPERLKAFLHVERSNEELFQFGLDEGFLPKHTMAELRKWEEAGNLQIKSLDNQKRRKGAFYIKNSIDRPISIKYKDRKDEDHKDDDRPQQISLF